MHVICIKLDVRFRANRHLKEVYEQFWSAEHQDILQRQLSQEGIERHFIPP